MPAFRRSGISDSLLDSRLTWFTGTAYPASPGGLWISLLSGMPLSDGSGVVELTPRVSVTYGTPSTQSGQMGYPHERYIQPSADVTFTPAGQPGPGVSVGGAAWALWGVASGGLPIYANSLAASILVGVPTTLRASEFKVTAAEPT
jgi:hypothetical protein